MYSLYYIILIDNLTFSKTAFSVIIFNLLTPRFGEDLSKWHYQVQGIFHVTQLL